MTFKHVPFAQFAQTKLKTKPEPNRLVIQLQPDEKPLEGEAWGESVFAGTGYSLRPNFVIDTGLVRGFGSGSTKWQVTSGFTYVLPRRLWGFSHSLIR